MHKRVGQSAIVAILAGLISWIVRLLRRRKASRIVHKARRRGRRHR